MAADRRLGGVMRAVRIEEFGGPDVPVPLELPDPAPGPGQALVRVAAAGVNRADALIRAGSYHRAGRPPIVPGLEAAGTYRVPVEAVFPLEQAAGAHRRLEERGNRGKTVLTMGG